MQKFLLDRRRVHVEIIVDYGLTDIVAERYDTAVRLGAQIVCAMIAARIGPDIVEPRCRSSAWPFLPQAGQPY
jgi:hypothetical protein